jgi:hypothetical protein
MLDVFDDWTAATWAQVIAAGGAVLAAFFAWQCARASVRAGTQAALIERLGRYDVILRSLKGWAQAGDNVRSQYRLEIHRSLRSSDPLPRCRVVGEPTTSLEGGGLAMVDEAIDEVERKVAG